MQVRVDSKLSGLVSFILYYDLVSFQLFFVVLLGTGNNLLLESNVVATLASTCVLAHLHRLLCLAWLIISYESMVNYSVAFIFIIAFLAGAFIRGRCLFEDGV